MGGELSPTRSLTVAEHYTQLNLLYQSEHERLNEAYATMLSLNTEFSQCSKKPQERIIPLFKSDVLQGEKAHYSDLFIQLEQSFQKTTSLKSKLEKGVLHLTRVHNRPLSTASLETLLEYNP